MGNDPKEKARRKAYQDRDRLKAEAMNAHQPLDPAQVGKVWVDVAENAEKQAMVQVQEKAETEVTIAELERMAVEFARSLPKAGGNPLVRRLKALDARIQGAVSKEEIRYTVARVFPRLDEAVRKTLNRFLRDCWQHRPLEQVRQVFHWMRVFYEAKTKDFDLGGVQ